MTDGTRRWQGLGRALMAALLGVVAAAAAAAEDAQDDALWNLLRQKYFDGAQIHQGRSVIELEAPYRAEDPALTPVSVHAKIPQRPDRYIERLYLIVDRNPQPLVGEFRFGPNAGKADLATRIRIDKYTNVRAIAVLNTGEHYMDVKFVKAQGGCSAPPASDLKAAMKRLGRMKFRTVGEARPGEPVVGQFSVSHPNITGLQLDQVTRAIIPEHYVKKVRLTYDGEVVLEADTGISISENPTFRFFFVPHPGGKLKAEVVDSKGNRFEKEFDVTV